ncbi:tRNA threonylcarbamoyladenosine biosynthesis protein TsaE [hydrothermal vent metagenome]|uniref:tRNA threonylcarbamoyladenosine biosynthesis protein TsaE n=1 Tax=hydrothermal vent metagenome TaxID=652676 RepID=A0A3B1CD80_9ZZZZ
MEFPLKIVVADETGTVNLAKKFSKVLKPSCTVALIGDLGTGKTFFTKNVIAAFGNSEVSSPTFAIVNVYETKFKIYHFDFYRIKKVGELYDIGFDDYLSDSDAITFIEWADLFPEILPEHRFEIKINYIDETKREFIIESL